MNECVDKCFSYSCFSHFGNRQCVTFIICFVPLVHSTVAHAINNRNNKSINYQNGENKKQLFITLIEKTLKTKQKQPLRLCVKLFFLNFSFSKTKKQNKLVHSRFVL